MKRTLLFALTLSAALSTNVIREYHYVESLKTWDEAQSYCREKFTDLATVENEDDNNRLLRVLEGHGEPAWLGLYDHLKGWKWALGDADFNNEFSNWNTSEPNLRSVEESCVVMAISGDWFDNACFRRRHAVCYYERGPAKYILVQTRMTWHEARTYCRSKYTDLVSVRNSSENNNIPLLSERTWIGLHRKTWAYWSDQTPKYFSNWKEGQPRSDRETLKSCAAVNTTTGRWSTVGCDVKHHFICQYQPLQRQTFKLKFQSEADLNDPAVQQQILEQLHAKLEKHGLPDFKLRWIQTDGQTFHKEQKRKKEEGSCG